VRFERRSRPSRPTLRGGPWSCLQLFRSPVPHSSSQNVGLPGSELNHGCCACSGFPPEQLAQGRQDSNLQPAVLETAALPIAPLPYGSKTSMTLSATFTEAHAINMFSTPENYSTQELRLRRTSLVADHPLLPIKEHDQHAVTLLLHKRTIR
jgi:hypothetical protein